MNTLWKVKHWLKYKPIIFFYSSMSKIFRFFTEVTDRFGYLLLGREHWEKVKEGIE